MAFKFSASERKDLAAFVAEFETARDRLGEWIEACATDARIEFEDRSEKWQESDAGQTASDWISMLEALAEEIEGFEIDLSQVEA